ncbi:MAG: hypothetical protein ACREBC_38215 [Pyrinomonadaceae bacterium]
MPRTKDQVLSIRTTAEVKALLRQVAARERRSVTSMVEVLVVNYAKDREQRYEMSATTANR